MTWEEIISQVVKETIDKWEKCGSAERRMVLL